MGTETLWVAIGAIGGMIGVATGLAALVISWKAYRTNDRMAKASEDSVRVAREAVDYQRAVEQAQNRARLVRPANSTISRDRRGEQGSIGVRLFNEGPDVARDVQIAVTLENGTVIGPSNPMKIPPEEERVPAVDIRESQFRGNDERVVKFRVTYRDGNGPQEMAFGVRIVGPWNLDWQTFPEPAG